MVRYYAYSGKILVVTKDIPEKQVLSALARLNQFEKQGTIHKLFRVGHGEFGFEAVAAPKPQDVRGKKPALDLVDRCKEELKKIHLALGLRLDEDAIRGEISLAIP